VAACSSSGDEGDASSDVTTDVTADTGLDLVVPDPGPDLAPDPGPGPDGVDVTPPDEGTPDVAPDGMVEDVGPNPEPVEDVGPGDTPAETVELPDNLACVGTIQWPEPEVATYTHTYGLVELLNQTPVVGATAKVCGFDDPQCDAPLSSGTTDAVGNVTLTFPAAAEGLTGYVEFSGDDIVTTLGFYRYTDNVAAYTAPGSFTYFVLGKTTMVALAALSNVEVDPARGHVIFSAFDCDGAPAAGISAEILSADVGTTPAYMEGGMPSTELTATTADGQGGLLNVPPGTSMLTATYEATGTEIGSAEVIVRAGAVTSTILVPIPLWEE